MAHLSFNSKAAVEDLETWVTADDFELVGYDPHPAIKIDMAV